MEDVLNNIDLPLLPLDPRETHISVQGGSLHSLVSEALC